MAKNPSHLLFRLAGGRPEPGIGPLLVTLGLGMTAQYALWTFFAIWAIEELGLSGADVGLAFLAAAGAGMAAGVAGGRLSDTVGRRRVILGATVFQCTLPLLALMGTPAAGIAVLIGLSAATPVRGAALSALLADLVPDDRREHAFGSMRVVFNLGAFTGPLLGALLVWLAWPALFAGVGLLYALSFAAVVRLPSLPPPAAEDGEGVSVRMFAQRSFALVFGAGMLAMVVYSAFETLMPISLTQTHGLEPAAWGVLFVVNPLFVTLLQLRVTRWAAPVPAGPKLALALALMGTSFLPLLASAAVPVLLLVLVVFVLGEMLWSPTADALLSRLAPAHARGTYMGTANMSLWLGGALAPALGLRLRDAWGDGSMWIAVALVSLGAGALYAAAAAAGARRADPVPEAVPEAA
ncbi:MAG: MFS transporter [Pseudomonadota bacterium]